jgi:uncharacterized protein
LECAFAQGYGGAAYELGLLQSSGYSVEAKARSLKTYHEGVKLGSAGCASTLSVEFNGMDLERGENLVGHVDTERAKRYAVIARALDHYRGRLKLPNLDKILPLPPAPLPKWDGDRDTLLNAAKAVAPPPEPSPASQSNVPEAMPQRHYLGEAQPLPPQRDVFLKLMIDAGWLRQVTKVSVPLQCNGLGKCPETGIWEGRISADHPLAALYNQWNRQAFVEAGQAFPDARRQHLDVAPADVRWTWLGSPNSLRVSGVHDIAL